MSTYIDALIIFILCFLLFPTSMFDALHITCILLMFALFCFLTLAKNKKLSISFGLLALPLTLAIPELLFICHYFIQLISFLSDYEMSALQNTLITSRDDSVEHELILKENNRQLLENQDDQIYIATLKERNRIAREIHDNVGHMLSRSILQVGAMLAICKDETLKPHLATLKETLDTAMNSIRNTFQKK